MKKLLIIAIAAIAVSVSSCNSNKSKTTGTDSIASDSVSNANIVFESSVYNFGKIKEGDKVSYDFKFKNTGTTPLIISNASASCGCTVPDYPHEPIAPGATAAIKVVFDSTGKSGMQNKQVMISSNAVNASTELFLKGEVQSLNK
ncbi:hypothetical protein ADIARSV_3588 [Arcticibacter svalbardensis MN12-7]|uniref:DUF1573 domain-containing protein n=1 Tax=Arcticibacter svalbardensis MN12-7 TaxID=1150600 RepID=R9GWF2_9SPHI|nr:DUF1573 domain-containing protein [Arcticibacter svalbardensis]EOR93259.1 hypothetical protein ADIARSV_3588 [Arcticibacter svalbardensis MN12-7]